MARLTMDDLPDTTRMTFLAYTLCQATSGKPCQCAQYNGEEACQSELAGARAVVAALLEIVKEPAAAAAIENILRNA